VSIHFLQIWPQCALEFEHFVQLFLIRETISLREGSSMFITHNSNCW